MDKDTALNTRTSKFLANQLATIYTGGLEFRPITGGIRIWNGQQLIADLMSRKQVSDWVFEHSGANDFEQIARTTRLVVR